MAAIKTPLGSLRGASFSAVLCTHTTIHNIGNAAFTRRFSFLPVVGYQTITSPAAGASIALAVQFEAVDGKTDIPLVDVLTVATPKASPAFGVAGDQIWKYDAVTGWVKYWWRTANNT